MPTTATTEEPDVVVETIAPSLTVTTESVGEVELEP